MAVWQVGPKVKWLNIVTTSVLPMNLQLGWDPVGTAHLGSTYYPHPGEGGSKEGSGWDFTPGSLATVSQTTLKWPFKWPGLSYTGWPNSRGAWGSRPESYLRPCIGVTWHQLDTVHWSEQHKCELPRCEQEHRQGMAGWDLEDMGNQRHCSDHCETIQTSSPVASIHLLFWPLKVPTTLSFVPEGLTCLLECKLQRLVPVGHDIILAVFLCFVS